MIKILFLAANPLDIDPLQLDAELEAIDSTLRQTDFRDQFELRSQWAVGINDIQELLLRHRPHIVHFSGHGSGASEIILKGEDGAATPAPRQALSNLFRILRGDIRCVILNACYSAEQAEAIGEHIPVVIGMSDAIADRASVDFSAAFYRALGYGEDMQTAFDLACNQLEFSDRQEATIPRLHGQGNPRQIRLVAVPSDQPGAAPAPSVDSVAGEGGPKPREKSSDSQRSTAIWVALIGAVATIAAALVANWPSPSPSTVTSTATPSVATATVQAAVAPTFTPQPATPTGAATSTVAAPVFPPTVTPPVARPLAVELRGDSCADVEERIEGDIVQAGGQRAADAALSARLRCAGDEVEIALTFPPHPARRLEFLAEPSLLTTTLKTAYARAFVSAAVGYALGDYGQAARLLEQIPASGRSGEAEWLWGQALMHGEQWPAAREAYQLLLEREDQRWRAYAHAGRALAYLLEKESVLYGADRTRLMEVIEACGENALAEVNAAVAAEPEQPLWLLLRVAVRDCPGPIEDFEKEVTEPNVEDAERALALTRGTGSFEEALSLAQLAVLYVQQVDPPDVALSIDLAQRSINIAPELSLPYHLLACIYYYHQPDEEQARAYFGDYLARLTLSWQEKRARESWQQASYCLY